VVVEASERVEEMPVAELPEAGIDQEVTGAELEVHGR